MLTLMEDFSTPLRYARNDGYECNASNKEPESEFPSRR